MNKRILLIQIRDPKDKMLEHEAACVRRKFKRLAVDLTTVNAVEEPIERDLLNQVDGVVIGGSGDFSVHHPLSQSFVQPLLKTLDLLTHLSTYFRHLFRASASWGLVGRRSSNRPSASRTRYREGA